MNVILLNSLSGTNQDIRGICKSDVHVSCYTFHGISVYVAQEDNSSVDTTLSIVLMKSYVLCMVK